jgi:hypothetical protein
MSAIEIKPETDVIHVMKAAFPNYNKDRIGSIVLKSGHEGISCVVNGRGKFLSMFRLQVRDDGGKMRTKAVRVKDGKLDLDSIRNKFEEIKALRDNFREVAEKRESIRSGKKDVANGLRKKAIAAGVSDECKVYPVWNTEEDIVRVEFHVSELDAKKLIDHFASLK